MIEVRQARPADAGAVAEIYNQGILGRQATFETRQRSAAEVLAWLKEPFPFLVAVDAVSGEVAGWVRGSTYRTRECYAGIAEFSIYVAEAWRRKGVGEALLAAFITAAEAAGSWKLLSRIFPENMASRRLCARHGFREVGIYEKHGRLDGVWRDVVIVERLLPANLTMGPG